MSYVRTSTLVRSLYDSDDRTGGVRNGLHWRKLSSPLAFSHLTPRFFVPDVIELESKREPFTTADVKWGLFDIRDRVVDYKRYNSSLSSDWTRNATARNARLGLLGHAAAVLFASEGQWFNPKQRVHHIRNEFVVSTIFLCMVYWMVRRGRCLQSTLSSSDFVFILNRAIETAPVSESGAGPMPRPIGSNDTEGWIRLTDRILNEVDTHVNACVFAVRLAYALLMSISAECTAKVGNTGKSAILFMPGEALWKDLMTRIGTYGQWTRRFGKTISGVMCTERSLRLVDVKHHFGAALEELGVRSATEKSQWMSGYFGRYYYDSVRCQPMGTTAAVAGQYKHAHLPFVFTHYCPAVLFEFWSTDHAVQTWAQVDRSTVASRRDFMAWCFSPKSLYGFIRCKDVVGALLPSYVRLLALCPPVMGSTHEGLVLDEIKRVDRLPLKSRTDSTRPLIFRLMAKYHRLEDPMFRHRMCASMNDMCSLQLVVTPSIGMIGMSYPSDVPWEIAPHGRMEQMITYLEDERKEGRRRGVIRLESEQSIAIHSRVSIRVALLNRHRDKHSEAVVVANVQVAGFRSSDEVIRGFERYCRDFVWSLKR